MTPLLKSGDTAWAAQCGIREVSHPCPVCFGKCRVTVILGNDEVVSTPCDYCGKGYHEPTGRVIECEWVATPELVIIARVATEDDGVKQTATYHTALGYYYHDHDLFATKEEATVRCEVRAAEHAEEERKKREWSKDYAHKNFSWHVGYHRREAKRAKEQFEYHSAKAVTSAQRAKTPVAGDPITTELPTA